MRKGFFARAGRIAIGFAFVSVTTTLSAPPSAQAGGDVGACCLGSSCYDGIPEEKCVYDEGAFYGAESTCEGIGGCPADDGCGNWKLEQGEDCDDGNTVSGDGCSDVCVTEYCGDGVVNDDSPLPSLQFRHVVFGEQCDDGNTEAGDGCNEYCQSEFCGDGIVNDATEQCDDANTDTGDFCVDCAFSYCGDGFVNARGDESLEQCDDGNTATGDGCDADCELEPSLGACCNAGQCLDALTAAACEETGGSYAGDASSCTSGICYACGDGYVQPGEACDDANTATGDGCSDACTVEECWTCAEGSPSSCTLADGAACDDGDECTLGDTCQAGGCTGTPPIVPAACRWVMVGGDDQRDVQSRTRDLVKITGDICGETTRVGESSLVTGDVVATETSGLACSVYAFATVDGDILTGGGSITGKPKDTILPGLTVSEVAGGTMQVQAGDPNDVLDARGGVDTDERVGECAASIDSIDTSASLIESLPQSQSLGDLRIDNNGVRTITASDVGGLNVVDITRVTTGNRATLVLDGGGNTDTTFVLRVQRKFYLRFQSVLELANGTLPEHVIVYGKGLCKIGEDVVGGGTLLCPNGKVKMEENTRWGGALVAGRQFIQVRHKSEITHVPLLVGAP